MTFLPQELFLLFRVYSDSLHLDFQLFLYFMVGSDQNCRPEMEIVVEETASVREVRLAARTALLPRSWTAFLAQNWRQGSCKNHAQSAGSSGAASPVLNLQLWLFFKGASANSGAEFQVKEQSDSTDLIFCHSKASMKGLINSPNPCCLSHYILLRIDQQSVTLYVRKF